MLPERAIAIFLFLCSFLSILITIGIVAVLLFEAITFFGDVSFIEFITGTRWTPLFSSKMDPVRPRSTTAATPRCPVPCLSTLAWRRGSSSR